MDSGDGTNMSKQRDKAVKQKALLLASDESDRSKQEHQTVTKIPYTMQSGPSFLHLNDTKAGMTGLDKEKINQIILQASKDSAYFKRQQEKQKALDQQIAALLHRKSLLTQEQIRCATAQMDAKASELEAQRRDMTRIIVHMDMDMFYAAVEMRDKPALASVPLAVGSNSMLSTSNYEARKYGVRAGMAGFIGRKLCPKLVIVPCDFKKYTAVSKEVMSVVGEYDPNYRTGSLDEAYFDLTDHVLERCLGITVQKPALVKTNAGTMTYPKEVWQTADSVVQEIRQKIRDKTQLTCSAGIAHNKMLAKVCSDINKPNGQYLLDASDPEAVEQFIANTRIRKIGGIGQVQEKHLKALGIETCADLFNARGLIMLLFTPALIDFYLRVSIGLSSNEITESDNVKRKSLGSETTFKATSDVNVLKQHLNELSATVSSELKEKKLAGRTITLVIKWANFISNDRSKSLATPTCEEAVILDTVTTLLQNELSKKPDTAIRLLGVRVSNFGTEADHKISGEPASKKPKKAQKAITDFVKTSPKKSAGTGIADCNDSFTRSSLLHPDHDFICVYCLSQFQDEESLEHHLDHKLCPAVVNVEENKSVFSIRCPVCQGEFESLEQINIHLDELCLKQRD